jgi:hypothetical protein
VTAGFSLRLYRHGFTAADRRARLEMGLEAGSIIAISDRLGLTMSVNAKLRPTCHWPNRRRQ